MSPLLLLLAAVCLTLALHSQAAFLHKHYGPPYNRAIYTFFSEFCKLLGSDLLHYMDNPQLKFAVPILNLRLRLWLVGTSLGLLTWLDVNREV